MTQHTSLYHPDVQLYIHSSPALDRKVHRLWAFYERLGNADPTEADRLFLDAATESSRIGNIGSLRHYVPHCFLVSRKCAAISEAINMNYASHYPSGLLDSEKMSFAGLIEDSMYLVGGNAKNTPGKRDSNPVHEILTYIQMKYMGYDELADSMAMHFFAPQILKAEQAQGRFTDVTPPKETLPLLVLTAVDALSTTEWLPDKYHQDYRAGVKSRIDNIIFRRHETEPENPVIAAAKNGGSERLRKAAESLFLLEMGSYPPESLIDLLGN